ncbi:hypothetical protein LCGC14_2330160 [marine sediment metagenome]|uniref:Uncharacterized protein n=1 Tax=marine sediment metagenome TaxID=412755 RepID=A0A0F9CFT5_9ZZZZ
MITTKLVRDKCGLRYEGHVLNAKPKKLKRRELIDIYKKEWDHK